MKLEDVILTPGTRAAQPNAADVPRGTLYYVTDEDRLERSNGTTWDEYAAPPGGGSGGGAADFDKGNVVLIQRGNLTGSTYLIVGGSSSTLAMNGSGGVTVVRDGQNLYTRCTSATTAGNAVGFVTGFTLCDLGSYPILDALVWAPDDLTDVRMFVGLVGGSPTNGDDPPNHSACFRFSSVAGDTGWTPITRDGSTTNVGASMGTVVASTRYRLRIQRDVNGVRFSVDGGADQTLTANLPDDSERLAVTVRAFPTTNSARAIGFDRARLIYGAPL